MILQALRAAEKLREGGAKAGSRWQTPCPCWGLITPEPFLTPNHLPFSCSGLLWYFQCDSKVYSKKTIMVLAFPVIFCLLSRHQVVPVYNTRASLISCIACDLEQSNWKRFGTQFAKALISSQKGTLQSRNTAQCRYHLLIQTIYCTVKNAKKNLLWKHQERLRWNYATVSLLRNL